MPQGTLFTRDFLDEGIKDTDAWRALDEDRVARFRAAAAAIFDAFPRSTSPNEAHTEDDLIWPVLAALDWHATLRRQNLSPKGTTDVPDGLLFPDAAAKANANKKRSEWSRYADGAAIVESKRWDRKLDRVDARADDIAVPSTQMLRYLRRVDDLTEGKLRWGVLTNGRLWRLYHQGAPSVSEGFLEIDLPAVLGLPGAEPELLDGDPEHYLRVFLLMFDRAAFLPRPDGRSFHRLSLDEGRLWEQRIAESLSELVFKDVFPALARGLVEADPDKPRVLDTAYLNAVRDAALIVLYRLLFVLFAEDRNLLPVRDRRYDDYGMRLKVREDIARRVEAGETFSDRVGPYFQHMQNLFAIVDGGEERLGLPPYNGGLFESRRAPILQRAVLPDAVFAPIVDALSRRDGRLINYRDLTVRQLGSIYERLLEYEVVASGDGIAVRPNIFARRGSGSYYTPDDLVRLIVERTLAPLMGERRAAFADAAETLKSQRGAKASRLERLAALDPAAAFLDLKVCDPAMGSGHFLVDLVDFLADHALEAMDAAAQSVEWGEYVSPVAASIAAIRGRILHEAKRHNWTNVDEDRLDDKQIVRRIILKRVIYGVDKNPMAVELAKVALWLHTFTVGAPLSFLDHHLRCGDSLYGEFVRPVEDELAARGAMMLRPSVVQAMNAAKGMAKVERMTDADIAEVKASASAFDGVSEATAPLDGFLGFIHAMRWLGPTAEGARGALDSVLDGQFGDPVRVAAGLDPPAKPKAMKDADFRSHVEVVTRARALADEQRFLNWEVAFPGVWTDWESAGASGGFDAVIGNPPWDRIKLQDVEWFAARRPDIARAPRAADRKRLIGRLVEDGDPLAAEYGIAAARAEAASRVARDNGQYPLLSRGDINIYALFVERAQRLLKPQGVSGLLVPSGIASDQSASAFFRGVSTTGRLGALFDFENRRVFFPDVDSRFKFCAFVTGGARRTFAEATCAFFLHDVGEIAGGAFALSPADFALVNPNTGTAPVFRTRRDADLTLAIYKRLPVLCDRSDEPVGPNAAWREDLEARAGLPGNPTPPVWHAKYVGMFHMTNDSGLFHTAAALQKDGCYRTAANRWKKGDAEFVPLYVGRMIDQFDHRAASVLINEQNLHNPAYSMDTTEDEHANPNFSAQPYYWVTSSEVDWPSKIEWAISFRDIARVTDVRTVIAAAVPKAGFGNTLPLIFPALPDERLNDWAGMEEYAMWVSAAFDTFREGAPLWLGNLNSFILDYVARQKVQSTHLNWYIVEQIPVLPRDRYDAKIGNRTVYDMVRAEVLKLTYTAHDMAAFARDLGHDGPPFAWDEAERRHGRARLDALHFMLYGLGRDEADDVLSTFPIVKREDEAAFGGKFVTRDLILGYMAAFAAGDTESRIAVNTNRSC